MLPSRSSFDCATAASSAATWGFTALLGWWWLHGKEPTYHLEYLRIYISTSKILPVSFLTLRLGFKKCRDAYNMLQHVTTIASIRKPFSRCLFPSLFPSFFSIHLIDRLNESLHCCIWWIPLLRGGLERWKLTDIFQKLKGHPPPHTEKYVSCDASAGTGGCGEVRANRLKRVFPCLAGGLNLCEKY